jgi:hypothetical protein
MLNPDNLMESIMTTKSANKISAGDKHEPDRNSDGEFMPSDVPDRFRSLNQSRSITSGGSGAIVLQSPFYPKGNEMDYTTGGDIRSHSSFSKWPFYGILKLAVGISDSARGFLL